MPSHQRRFGRGGCIGLALLAWMLAMLAIPVSLGVADDRDPAPVNETWRAECSTCHVPYPPKRLPARSWRVIMNGLDRHFGTDASLDPQAAGEVAAFLQRHAGRDLGGPPTVRLTETSWFRRKHRGVPATVWRQPDVKSAANCGACHPGADRGDYDDATVRLPR